MTAPPDSAFATFRDYLQLAQQAFAAGQTERGKALLRELVGMIAGPEDPTPEMIERGQRVTLATGRALNDAQVHDIWQAMYDEWLSELQQSSLKVR